MKLVRCNNGHFYDQDKYGDNCPYCVQASEALAKPATPEFPKADVKREMQEPVAEMPAKSNVPEKITEEIQEQSEKPVLKEPVNIIEQEENKTVGYYSRVIGIEPVVGWLVCIEGVYKGESFKLKSGRNFIGRAANMDIVLSADHSISRFKHATVIYEPRSKQFIVTSGEAHELCYINDEVVLSNVKLQAYDVLDLGNTSLMLIPCCGENFTWETGIVKK